MIILDRFDPPPAKFVRTPMPEYFKTTLEEDRFWQEENRRWREGYAGLTGAHYFYLTQCHLKDIDGNIFYPTWRDVDDYIFTQVDECMAAGEGLLIYKRREVGATSIFVGGLPFWFMRVHPGSVLNLTSKDQDGIFRMFEDKIITTYENANEVVFNPEPAAMNRTKQSVYLKLAMKSQVEGKVRIKYSEVNLKETSERPESPNNFSGSRAKYTYVDEAPLHKRIKTLLKSIEATRKRGIETAGFLAMAGTVEEKLTGDELANFYQLIQDSKFLKIRPILIPAWMGLITTNGWSDEKAGTEHILREREELEKADDKSFLLAHKRNYPLVEDDIFDFSQTGMFETDVAELLSEQLKKVIREGSPEVPSRIFTKDGYSYDSAPDKNGTFYMIEAPRADLQYYIAIDGTATGKEMGPEKGSFVASIVFKGYDPKGGSFEPVHIYYERPNTVQESYEKITRQFFLYNKFGGMKKISPEPNAATMDHFGLHLKKLGLFGYLAKKIDISGKGYTNTNKIGNYATGQLRDWQVRQANVFLRMYGRNIRSKLLLQDLTKPSESNTDLRDAFFMFMVAIPDFDKPIKKKEEKRYRTTMQLGVDGSGQTVWISKKVALSTPTRFNHSEDNHRRPIELFVESMRTKYGPSWYPLASIEEKNEYLALKGGSS